MLNKKEIHRLVLAAMLLAIGLILPSVTGQIREIGNMLLPMHIPVLLCAFLCDWRYASFIGAALPFLRSLIFGMPKLYPNAVAMAVELLCYGLICGLIYAAFKKRNIFTIYLSLICAMIGGRVVWGFFSALLYSLLGAPKTFEFFFGRAVIEGIPGIILQLVLIPSVVIIIQKARKHG